MNNAKVTPLKNETSFPQKNEKSDNNDANDSKVNLLETERHQENIEPANDQPEINDTQRAEKQAPAKFASELQSISQYHEVHNIPITDSSRDIVENA